MREEQAAAANHQDSDSGHEYNLSSSSDSLEEEIVQLTAMDIQETLPLEASSLAVVTELLPGGRLDSEVIAFMCDEFGVC